LKERTFVVRLKLMPTCRICTQNYPLDQFVSGNGPRYQVCVRCAVDNDLVDREDAPQLYSDDIVKARTSLFARRYRMWIFVLLGWPLYLTLGRGIELWSSVFLVVLVICTLAAPVMHFLGSVRFNAELAKLSP
tara:strand:+ start:118 stop:516 length:399 start_codon:yes stop_codon:yes gene_type:complete